MDLAGAAPPPLVSTRIRRLLVRRPELVAGTAVVAAWITVFLLAISEPHGPHVAMMPDAGSEMAGMSMPGPAGTSNVWTTALNSTPYWQLMTVAMMGPAALAGVRHTGVNSLYWRRARAMVEFSAAYLLVWTVFGFAAEAAGALTSGASGSLVLAVVVAIAAAWQLSPWKRRRLRDCHRSLPLPPRGWRAERAAFRFGLHNGLACLGSCWCLMLIMLVAPAGHLLWMVALTGVSTAERTLERPRRTTRLVAAGLGAAAVGALFLALA